MVQYVCQRCGRNWYTAVTQAEGVGRCQDCGGELCPASQLLEAKDDQDDDISFSLHPLFPR